MATILNFKMAATRGREYVEGIFPSIPWVGLLLYKCSCLLNKLNDSGVYVVFAALFAAYAGHDILSGDLAFVVGWRLSNSQSVAN